MNKVFVNNTLYTFLNTRPDGERKGINNLMNMFVDAADEETFAKWVEYHLSICERQDLIGASHHVLDILRKV